MNKEQQRLITNIKQQATVFLLDAGEFYPFGVSIDQNNDLKPVGSYTGTEFPTSQELIELLENHFNRSIQDGSCKAAILAVDVLCHENEQSYDAIEIRLFENGQVSKSYIKYFIEDSCVEFL